MGDEVNSRRADWEWGAVLSKGIFTAMGSYTLIGAIMLLGGIGYAVDWWRGTSPWFLLAGLALGLIVGFYELARAVFKR